jgi:hypothetical protein
MMRLHSGALDVFLSLVALMTCAGISVCAGQISMPGRLEARVASGTEDGPSARGEGKVVAWVEDEGRGGSPHIDFAEGCRTVERSCWMAEAHRLFPDDGGAEERVVDALLMKVGK